MGRRKQADTLNYCVICGGVIPEGYTVHFECTSKTQLRFMKAAIYHKGDRSKHFFYCPACGAHVPETVLKCESCGYIRYETKKAKKRRCPC